MLGNLLKLGAGGQEPAFLLQLSRIASALERLAELQELALRAQGLNTTTDPGEGEVLETDEEFLAKLEWEEERIKHDGLPPGHNFSPLDEAGKGWPAVPQGDPPPAATTASIFPASGTWALPVGPEGAEAPDAPPEESGRA